MSKGSFSRIQLFEMCNKVLTDTPSDLYKQSFLTSCDTVKDENESERSVLV